MRWHLGSVCSFTRFAALIVDMRVLHSRRVLILKALQLAARCRNFLPIGIPPRLVKFFRGEAVF